MPAMMNTGTPSRLISSARGPAGWNVSWGASLAHPASATTDTATAATAAARRRLTRPTLATRVTAVPSRVHGARSGRSRHDDLELRPGPRLGRVVLPG